MRIFRREPRFDVQEQAMADTKVVSHHICDYCGARIDMNHPPILYYVRYHQSPGFGEGRGEPFLCNKYNLEPNVLLASPFVFCNQVNHSGNKHDFSFCELKMAAEMASASPNNDHWLVDLDAIADVWRACRVRVLGRMLASGELTRDQLIPVAAAVSA